MSAWVWVFSSVMVFLVIYFTFVLLEKHKENRKRQQMANVIRPNNVMIASQNLQHQPGVIYTIPTTRQLADTYPTLTQTTPPINMQNNMTYGHDMPPTYDQVVIHPVHQPHYPPHQSSTTIQQNVSPLKLVV